MNTKEISATLTIPVDSMTSDQVANAVHEADNLLRVVKEYRDLVKDGAIEWIDAHGAIDYESVEGPKRMYVGTTKTKFIPDGKAEPLLEALLNASGGDVAAIGRCISKTGYKVTECKSLIGQDADDFFEVRVTSDIKTGKPKRGIKDARVEDLERGSDHE